MSTQRERGGGGGWKIFHKKIFSSLQPLRKCECDDEGFGDCVLRVEEKMLNIRKVVFKDFSASMKIDSLDN